MCVWGGHYRSVKTHAHTLTHTRTHTASVTTDMSLLASDRSGRSRSCDGGGGGSFIQSKSSQRRGGGGASDALSLSQVAELVQFVSVDPHAFRESGGTLDTQAMSHGRPMSRVSGDALREEMQAHTMGEGGRNLMFPSPEASAMHRRVLGHGTGAGPSSGGGGDLVVEGPPGGGWGWGGVGKGGYGYGEAFTVMRPVGGGGCEQGAMRVSKGLAIGTSFSI